MKAILSTQKTSAGGMVIAAALLSVSIGARCAFAQTMPAPPPPPPAMATLLVDEKLDYSQLYNTTYDYFDIIFAKSDGFRDDDVARAVKIAKKTGVPFRHIVDRKYAGDSWASIADSAGLPRTELRHIDKEKDEVAAYEAAYLATGYENTRRNSEASIRAQVAMGPKK